MMAIARAAMHWLFGYIHPYPDGNGRIAVKEMLCSLQHCDPGSTTVRTNSGERKRLSGSGAQGGFKPLIWIARLSRQIERRLWTGRPLAKTEKTGFHRELEGTKNGTWHFFAAFSKDASFVEIGRPSLMARSR